MHLTVLALQQMGEIFCDYLSFQHAQLHSPRWDPQRGKDSLCPAQLARKESTGMAQGEPSSWLGATARDREARGSFYHCCCCNTSFWEATRALPIKLQNKASACMNNPQRLSPASSQSPSHKRLLDNSVLQEFPSSHNVKGQGS